MITREYGHPKFYRILDELADLHSKKNHQYATKDNPLGNFTRTGYLTKKLWKEGIDERLAIALAYMSKQVDGVYEMVGEGKKDTVEELKDKLMDIAIYSVICIILCEEK